MLGRSNAVSEHYCGSDTHRYINALIESTGDILIVSPYLDDYYAGVLSSKKSGRKFYVISSSMERRAAKLLTGKRSALPILGYIALSIALLYLSFIIGLNGLLLLPSFIPIVVGIIKHRPVSSNVALKIPKRFVHAKMYISGTMAITGSANLTYAGTHKNVEQISITHDSGEIGRLREQFWNLWREL